ncbi:tRNA-splicing endonuclease subunit Sen2 [Gracilariopsis chorda]|uniref:tRNA-intron lyase n=1 Tax=Gracilariopsis chorda TaxID=448386 RepID=A0A2V3IEF5_9FLOR|nr:tRNA-splicing endonuclease subunit Sen2 [Gracilariopsis chorda]|eukprot:PXF40432.1 tRNA-splicing endonuclease subunit Sen2 [Gracilariopsis chorda]
MRQLLALQPAAAAAAGEAAQSRVDVEHLQLPLVDAFYLAFVTRQIVISDAAADAAAAWRLFCARCARFPLLFVAYARYRAAGWLPKSGLKYGVHWVLYPTKRYAHTHAPYCVVFHFSNRPNDARLDSSWIALQNRLRLVNNVAKTLVIARLHVAEPLDLAASISRTFDAVRLTELTIDRWLP